MSPSTRYAVAWVFSAAVALAAVAAYSGGGTMEREATLYVTQYTSNRPFINKVFDPHANDLGTYQARELSYFADCVDAICYRFLYQVFHVPVFVPLSAVITTLLSSFVFFRSVSRSTRVDPVTAVLVFGCFATSFVFLSSMSVFYRSGKPLLTVALLALLFHLRSLHLSRTDGSRLSRSRAGECALAGALAIIAGLLDRQGVFYVASCTIIVGLHYLWTRQLKDVLVTLIAALLILQAYNLAIAPLLVHAINGYWPDFQYQLVPQEHLWRLPAYAILAIQMLVENATLLFGGSGQAALILTTLTAAALLFSHLRRYPRARRPAELRQVLEFRPDRRLIAYFALGFLVQVVMFALMIARHPVIYVSLDHRYWYYPLPYAATLLFGAVVIADALIARIGTTILRAGLAVMLIGNVSTLRDHQRTMQRGAWFAPVSAQSDAAARSLRSGAMDPALTAEYARFVRFHARFR